MQMKVDVTKDLMQNDFESNIYNMIQQISKIYFKIGSATLMLVFLDQLIKNLAQKYVLAPYSFLPWASIRYEQNTGIAWSIPFPYPLLIIVNLLLVIILPIFIVKYFDIRQARTQIILIMMMAGGLGNMLDRVFRGYVIDYISVGWFPVFNLADSLLTISIFLLLLFYDKILGVSKSK